MDGDFRRPWVVKVAVALQLLSVSVEFGVLIFPQRRLLVGLASQTPLLLVGVLLGLLLLLGLLYAIYLGRNWARITLLLWWVLGFVVFCIVLVAHPIYLHVVLRASVQVAFGVIRAGINLASLLLLFTPASNAWFHRVPPVAAAPEQWTPDY